MTYRRRVPVEFNHCDPAGIVFYPRYFEMVQSVVENFFREAMDYPYARMMAEGTGVPTVRIEMQFRAPSRLGEVLAFALVATRVGRSSVRFRITAHGPGPQGGEELRLNGELTLVFASLKGAGSLPWPDPIWSRLETVRHREPNEPA